MAVAALVDVIVLFGGTGDLAQRMLFPALYFLDADGFLNPDIRIVATARAEVSRTDFIAKTKESVALRVGGLTDEVWGRFEARLRKGVELRIYANPVALRERTSDPVCVWHAAVMERLFRALVSPRARVRETSCCARGDVCCCFEIDWTRRCAAAVSPSQRPAQI